LAKQKYDKAIQDYDEAIRLNLKNAIAFSNRGLVWFCKKEYDKAIQDYDEAIKLNAFPYNDYTLYHRGNAWFAKKEYDKAIQDYDEAIRGGLLGPNRFAPAFAARGRAWYRKKDYDRAIKDYDEAIRRDRKFAWAFNDRGLVWFRKKEYDKAITDFDEAIRLDREYPSPFNNKAYVLAACTDDKLRDVARAQELMKTVVKLRPVSPYNEETLGIIAAAQGRFDDAIRHQKQALEDKEYVGIEQQKATAAKRLKQYEQKKPWRE
jgi:tetratricopeptide (TPR) repeat protein